MEEAAAVRRAVAEAVRDVVPEPLREDITAFVNDGSLAPGALVLLTAGRLGEEPDFEAVDGLVEHGVGVQLIYDGLRLTRELVHGDPWTAGEKAAGDMHILAADVMVARGFYLLARTEAAEAAVEVVRSFGRDQTVLREGGEESLDRQLEVDVLELAVLAGAAAVSAEVVGPEVRAFADARVGEGSFPAAEELLSETTAAELAGLSESGGEGRTVRSD